MVLAQHKVHSLILAEQEQFVTCSAHINMTEKLKVNSLECALLLHALFPSYFKEAFPSVF